MEYKGIQYQLVRTANPTGWKWTILFDDNRTKTGQQADRVEAIAKAERAIDQSIARLRRSPL